MGKSSGKFENDKKAAGNAKKAAAAQAKQDVVNKKKAAEEDADWAKGSKDTSKKADAEAKKREAAAKKAERDKLLAEEEKSQKATVKTSKSASKKTSAAPSRGLDLSQLDGEATKLSELSASGIDGALDMLDIAGGSAAQQAGSIDRHPERRFKAALAKYEAQRMPELEKEGGLRRQQRIDQIYKEFQKHPDNPFNQVKASAMATGDELREIAEQDRARRENLYKSS